MPYIEDDPLLTEQVKVILREFHPAASASEVQAAFDALDALLNNPEEKPDAAEI